MFMNTFHLLDNGKTLAKMILSLVTASVYEHIPFIGQWQDISKDDFETGN